MRWLVLLLVTVLAGCGAQIQQTLKHPVTKPSAQEYAILKARSANDGRRSKAKRKTTARTTRSRASTASSITKKTARVSAKSTAGIPKSKSLKSKPGAIVATKNKARVNRVASQPKAKIKRASVSRVINKSSAKRLVSADVGDRAVKTRTASISKAASSPTVTKTKTNIASSPANQAAKPNASATRATNVVGRKAPAKADPPIVRISSAANSASIPKPAAGADKAKKSGTTVVASKPAASSKRSSNSIVTFARVRAPNRGKGCTCPYDIDGNGRRCGTQSDYFTQPQGRTPVCYK